MKKPEQITKQALENFTNVYTAIEYVHNVNNNHLKMPSKPFLKSKHTSKDVDEYSSTLLSYEQALPARLKNPNRQQNR